MATTPGPQGQRKRTLEALERRFAVAKAELLQQQKKNKKTSAEEHGKETFSSNSFLPNASIAPSSNSSSKKGKFSFLGPSTSQDVEENGQAYSQLSEPIHEILLPADSKDHYKPLCCIVLCYEVFETFKPMHEMWKSYMNQLLKITGKNQLAQCLLGADLHGALIVVAECKITTFTGVSGIIICETAETFGIVTQDDKLRERDRGREDTITSPFVVIVQSICAF
ncbi:hypothetical protein CRYUN_Cryun08bG0145700 [Craigia yunnanensis]